MSLLLFPSMESEKISMVTLLAALAVCEGIRASTGLEGTIKWPNDILLSGKKVSGILTEGSLDIDGIKYIVCGIGINANLAALDKSIEKTATSILLEAKTPCNRKDVIGSVLTGFLTYYRKFLEEKNLEFIRSKYEKHLITKNREVYIDGPKGGFFAMAQGIDEEGALVVTDEKGDRRRIVSGEVSIRGLCGYAE